MDLNINNKPVFNINQWNQVTVRDLFDTGIKASIIRLFKSIACGKNLFREQTRQEALKTAHLIAEKCFFDGTGVAAAIYKNLTGRALLYDGIVLFPELSTEKSHQAALSTLADQASPLTLESLNTKIENARQELIDLVDASQSSSFTAPLYKTHAGVQRAALAVSQPYMDKIQALRGEVKSLESILSPEDLSTLNKKIDALISIFIDDVKRKRAIIIYTVHNNGETNRNLVRGVGANNTYHVPSQNIRKLHQITSDAFANLTVDIPSLLEDAKAIVIKRSTAKDRDGIGAMGGLAETIRRMFPEFDEGKFNQAPELMKQYLHAQRELYQNRIKGGKEEYNRATNEHAIATADLLIQYLDAQTKQPIPNLKPLQTQLKAHVDDLEFTPSGTIEIKTDPIKTGMRAASRETAEESGEIASLAQAIRELQPYVKNIQLSFGDTDNRLVDDHFFLSMRGITHSDAPAQCVSPIMFTTAVPVEAMEQFENSLQNSETGTGFVNPISHGEVAGTEVLSLNALRRRNGVLNNKLLTEQISDPIIAAYAYRYPHEHMGTAVKLSISQIAAQVSDSKVFEEILCEMVRADQLAIFLEDQMQHRISYLASAKNMFAQHLAAATQAGKQNLDTLAYTLLAKELQIDNVGVSTMAHILEKMDLAAEEVYDLWTAKQSGGMT